MLPIGGERQLEANLVEPVTPSGDMIGSVLAVSQATCPEVDHIVFFQFKSSSSQFLKWL